jgi:DNA-binding transcriptional MerR regulator
MADQLLIGDLARETGVTDKTIRYYEEIGILPKAARLDNGYRVYDTGDVARLQFVRHARALDLSLDEIDEIMAFRERGEAPCLYVMRVIDEKIDKVGQHIQGLVELRQELINLRQAAQDLPTDDVEWKACVCHLIQNREIRSCERDDSD